MQSRVYERREDILWVETWKKKSNRSDTGGQEGMDNGTIRISSVWLPDACDNRIQPWTYAPGTSLFNWNSALVLVLIPLQYPQEK